MLDIWIKDYPYDFAVPGAASALTAFVKSVLTKTYLLHYGSDFLPFLELLPGLKDRDKAWALKVDHPNETDDVVELSDDDERATFVPTESPTATPQSHAPSNFSRSVPAPTQHTHPTHSRERKPSLPLSSRAFLMSVSSSSSANLSDVAHFERHMKTVTKRLVSLSQELNAMDPSEIAQEITLTQLHYFQQIKVCLLTIVSSFDDIHIL